MLLHGGNAVSGSFDKKELMADYVLRFMDKVSFDAYNLGNQELTPDLWFTSYLKKRASVPLLCSNLKVDLGLPVYQIIKRNGLKIGIIGVVAPHLLKRRIAQRQINPPLLQVAALVSYIRPLVDVVMIIAHTGYKTACDIARQVQGVDIVMAGHIMGTRPPQRFGNAWVLAAGGHWVGRVDLALGKGISISKWWPIYLSGKVPEDVETRELLKGYREKAKKHRRQSCRVSPSSDDRHKSHLEWLKETPPEEALQLLQSISPPESTSAPGPPKR
ncbi:MAG: hypothetical protein DRG33_04355 [Deltaproteobacteria bacterium]|nr:MAG: hypothetical protein DRG33_04355 [Deltaproteobacteria bacterium]